MEISHSFTDDYKLEIIIKYDILETIIKIANPGKHGSSMWEYIRDSMKPRKDYKCDSIPGYNIKVVFNQQTDENNNYMIVSVDNGMLIFYSQHGKNNNITSTNIKLPIEKCYLLLDNIIEKLKEQELKQNIIKLNTQ